MLLLLFTKWVSVFEIPREMALEAARVNSRNSTIGRDLSRIACGIVNRLLVLLLLINARISLFECRRVIKTSWPLV